MAELLEVVIGQQVVNFKELHSEPGLELCRKGDLFWKVKSL